MGLGAKLLTEAPGAAQALPSDEREEADTITTTTTVSSGKGGGKGEKTKPDE